MVSTIAMHALMFEISWPLPWEVSVPSFNKTICGSVVFFFQNAEWRKEEKDSQMSCVCVLWTFVRVEKRCANDDDADELSISHVRKEREREKEKGSGETTPNSLHNKKKKSRRRRLSLSSFVDQHAHKKKRRRVEEQKQKTRTDQSPVGHLHERRHVVIIPLSVKLYAICSFRARASRFVRLTVKKFFFLFSLFSRGGGATGRPAPSIHPGCVKTNNSRASRIKKKKRSFAREKISQHTPTRASFLCDFCRDHHHHHQHTQKKRDGIVIDER